MAKDKTLFFCTNCGNEFPKWQGKCPACGQWNTIVEAEKKPVKTGVSRLQKNTYKQLADPDMRDEIRFDTGIGELNRVLGGGAVRGSLVLISGEPGVGKSTLLLQICQSLCREGKVLYISGEESERQIKMRADRLGVSSDNLYVLSENDLSLALESAGKLKPRILIVDSVQTIHTGDETAATGSVSQVKACTFQLMQYAKSENVTVFVVGHVNKDGAIAGPKVLEHMVDCVLYFEGDRHTTYRMLRAAKNRFGSTNEIGVFDMQERGLIEVESPSQMLLSGRPESAPGTCIACVMEGTRPVLAEIQALLVSTSFNVPRRTTNGFDYSRAMMLLAVAEKRGGIHSGNCDAYINVVGGLTIDEPAADLPMILAVFSSAVNRPLGDDLVAIGEVGLTGELRSVSMIEQRIREAARLGFKRCIIPAQGTENLESPEGLRLIRARDIAGAVGSL